MARGTVSPFQVRKQTPRLEGEAALHFSLPLAPEPELQPQQVWLGVRL